MNITRKGSTVNPCHYARYLYNITTPMGKDGKMLTGCQEHIALSRKVAAEGMVLLENDGILPLKKKTKVALFGVGSIDYIKGGGGSGNVRCAYTENLYEGFAEKKDYPVFEPLSQWYYDYCVHTFAQDKGNQFTLEPLVPKELMDGAVAFCDTAIFVLHRYSTESFDRSAEKGDFYLTDSEEVMIERLSEKFSDIIVVLDVGGIVDLTWARDNPRVKAVLLAWQAGMEGGGAIADILCGDVNPSGKLTDTFAEKFSDYPFADNFTENDNALSYYEDIYVGYRYFLTVPGAREKILYPFGYGLSYTDFAVSDVKAEKKKEKIVVTATVKNTGKTAGRESVQCYYSAPCGKLGKPSIELAAFAKTRLLSPGESQTLKMSFDISLMASYDDLGKRRKSAYILEQGNYHFFVGQSSVDLVRADYEYTVEDEFVVVEQLTQLCAPNRLPYRMLADGTWEDLPHSEVKEYDPQYHLPSAALPIGYTHACDDISGPVADRTQKYFRLSDVIEGKLTLDEFMKQMDVDEMLDLLGGHHNYGLCNTSGIGGNKRLGIPELMTCDGPAGIRLFPETGVAATAWPCATLIACTFDTDLMYQVGKAGAKEAKELAMPIWLSPALNIHRNPMCGRNFEYYSEDPVVSGLFAAASVQGIQSEKVAATPKHFACNSREDHRKFSDSRISERALREIYLKGFEICVKEADPWLLMTSYNAINNVMACENYELITGILRGEWHYRGAVTSDWSVMSYQEKCVKAGNDIRMPHAQADDLREAYQKGTLRKEQIYFCARRVLELLLKLD